MNPVNPKKMIPDTSLEASRKPCLSLDLPHFDAPTVGVMLLHSRSRERSDWLGQATGSGRRPHAGILHSHLEDQMIIPQIALVMKKSLVRKSPVGRVIQCFNGV